MSNLSWFGYFVFILCCASMSLLAVIASGQLRDSLKAYESQIRRFSMAVLLIGTGYFYVTIPIISPFYDFSSKESYSAEIEPAVLLRDYGNRIENLETELKRLNEQSEKALDHLELIVWILWFGLLIYGSGVIFGKDDNSTLNDAARLNLNE